MSIEKPFALTSPHYGFHCNIIQIKGETAKTVSAIERSSYSSRWSERVSRVGKYKILARFDTEDEAVAAMQAGVAAARAHDGTVSAALKAHEAAKLAQREAWKEAIAPRSAA